MGLAVLAVVGILARFGDREGLVRLLELAAHDIGVYYVQMDNRQGRLRAQHLKASLPRGVHIHAVEGVRSKWFGMVEYPRTLMQEYIRGQHRYGILCDSDTVFHPDLLKRLTMALADAGPRWHALHMCPGCLWGRQQHDYTWKRTPERHVMASWFRPAGQGRVAAFTGPNSCWVGGPLAVFTTRPGARLLLNDYNAMQHGLTPSDVTLNRIAVQYPQRYFVAYNPPLCVEKDSGSSQH